MDLFFLLSAENKLLKELIHEELRAVRARVFRCLEQIVVIGAIRLPEVIAQLVEFVIVCCFEDV
jgi:hypothetical protein